MIESKIEKVKEFWNKNENRWEIGRGIYWLEHTSVQERINKKTSGDIHKNPYHYLMDFLTRNGIKFPLTRCLTLGCGVGDLERGLSKYNFCQRHDAFDISDTAIKTAKEEAEAQKLRHLFYKAIDINELSLTPNTYDVIFGVTALSHFKNLEHIFSEVQKSLKPEGIFFVYDFIGPTKFQWTDKQLTIVNNLLQILPEKYRLIGKDTKKTICRRPTIEEMNIDPSEAIRSGDILKLLSRYFEIIETKYLGGTILNLLLQDIAKNFDYSNPYDTKLLNALFEIEDVLMEIDEIPSDFVVIIAKKGGVKHIGSEILELECNINKMPDKLPIPTGEMIFKVTGQYDADAFCQNGIIGAECIKNILTKNGKDISRFGSVLDFGCGCGRIMRHWNTLKDVKFYGVDYNPLLLNFCRKAFQFGEFKVNSLDKPLDYQNEKFDFIYAISVFTHLPENLQFFWINELKRVLKPGGFLYMTTHGLDRLDHPNLNEMQRHEFLKGNIVVVYNERPGTNDCGAFHPEQYVRNKLAKGFRIVDFIPSGAKDANQDVYLLQKL